MHKLLLAFLILRLMLNTGYNRDSPIAVSCLQPSILFCNFLGFTDPWLI